MPPHCWLVLPALSEPVVETEAGPVGTLTASRRAAPPAGGTVVSGVTVEIRVASPHAAPASRTSRRAAGSGQCVVPEQLLVVHAVSLPESPSTKLRTAPSFTSSSTPSRTVTNPWTAAARRWLLSRAVM